MFVVATTVLNDGVYNTVNSSPFATTYDAWDALLDALDATTSTWTDEDALQSYGAAVRAAVKAEQGMPGFVALTAPGGQLIVLGVIETGRA